MGDSLAAYVYTDVLALFADWCDLIICKLTVHHWQADNLCTMFNPNSAGAAHDYKPAEASNVRAHPTNICFCPSLFHGPPQARDMTPTCATCPTCART